MFVARFKTRLLFPLCLVLGWPNWTLAVQTATLTVRVDQPGVAVRPMLYGII